MAQAKSGDTVKVHYTGKLKDGTVFDSSQGRDPIEFKMGENQVIPGFEKAVEGMSEGEKTVASIPMDEAYGPRKDNLIVEIDQTSLPEDINPEVGQMLTMQQPDGNQVNVRVAELAEGRVTLDANHPLAGEDLTFEIEIVEIQAA
jgi:FKBP-type peptidyl-prolyl cis-trans isomerase 2